MIKSSYIESIVGLFRFYNTKNVLNSQRNPVILMTRFLINIKKVTSLSCTDWNIETKKQLRYKIESLRLMIQYAWKEVVTCKH